MPPRLRPRHRQVARQFGTAGQNNRVEILHQYVGRRINADVLIGAKLHALRFHLRNPAINVRFFHLEIGNAVTQQAADAIRLLEHNHLVADARELLRGGKTRRARADHGDALAGFALGRLRCNPTHLPTLVDNRVLDRLDTDRVVVDVERAGCFTRGRTNAPGEFRKIIGGMQCVQCFPPILPIHQIVEIRNDVVDRTTGLTKRDAAIHAARTLRFRFVVVQMKNELLIIFQAFRGRERRFAQSLIFQKSGWLAHANSFALVVRVRVVFGCRYWIKPLFA